MGQGIKLPGVHAARYHKIAGAFGCAFYQERRFDVHKPVLVQVIACGTVYSVAQFHIAFYGIAAQVEIAVFHAQVVAAIGIVLYGKGRCGALVEDGKFANSYLNFACW